MDQETVRMQPGEHFPDQDIPMAEPYPGLGVHDLAELIVQQQGDDRSNDTRIMRAASWWNSDDTRFYELERHELRQRGGKNAQPVTYSLKVYAGFDRTAPERYRLAVTDRYQYQQLDEHGEPLEAAQQPADCERIMLGHLRTATVDPDTCEVLPSQIAAAIALFEAEDFAPPSRFKRFLKALGRVAWWGD